MPDFEKPRDINELFELPEFQKLLADYKAMIDEGFYKLVNKYNCSPDESRDFIAGLIKSELDKLDNKS